MKITSKEIETVSKLEPEKRYQYFIKQVADTEKMYSLVDKEGSWAIADVDDKALFSVWSASESAQACALGEWGGFSVKEFTIEDFEDEIIDEIDANEYLINVFSVNGKSGFIVDYNEFARDLSEDLKKYH